MSDISGIKHKSFLKNSYSFPRLLAKIAYAFTVAQFGLDNLEESFLPKTITGEDKGICKYVGTCTDKIMRTQNTLHDIMLSVTENREIAVRIKLFLSTEAPEYLVIVGILKEEGYKSFLSKSSQLSLVDCNK
jgi:hypothetical protein